jgi:hypothetical protein
MAMYLELGEPNEVLAARRAYPKAAEESDACMLLLARAYLALGDRNKALLWATAAGARNPQNAEATSLRQELGGEAAPLALV